MKWPCVKQFPIQKSGTWTSNKYEFGHLGDVHLGCMVLTRSQMMVNDIGNDVGMNRAWYEMIDGDNVIKWWWVMVVVSIDDIWWVCITDANYEWWMFTMIIDNVKWMI